jgi:hypothetical protein
MYPPVVPRREVAVLDRDLREILGPPPIINGEDPNSYNKLHDPVRSAVAPTDVIEEMWVRDVVDAFWESLRFRRLRAKLFVACEHEGLRLILESMVDADETDKLVYGWLDRNPRNVKQVNKLLEQAGFGIDRRATSVREQPPEPADANERCRASAAAKHTDRSSGRGFNFSDKGRS